MPGQKTKFSEVWLSSVDSNGQQISEWHQKDEYHGYCHFCERDIGCDKAGKAQLLHLCAKKKHKGATKHAKDKK